MSFLPGFDQPDPPPQASRLGPKLRSLAERGVYFGGSSWKYEGWLGSIYSNDLYVTRGRFSKKKFDDECLSEYTRTFSTVCGDFAFYQFPSDAFWARLFAEVPDVFRFGLKVPEDITVAFWPRHARYGAKAGEPNTHFLDAETFTRLFARPLEPYRDKLGPLIFEFGTFNRSTFATPFDFLARLDPFLRALPDGFLYAIEIRNPEFLIPEYLDLLHERGVSHVFNAWTRMPLVEEQIQLEDAFTADFIVSRALLTKGRSYEQAVASFEPYERTQQVDESTRRGVGQLAREALKRKCPAYLFVNNRLEGHAPSTIEAIIDELP